MSIAIPRHVSQFSRSLDTQFGSGALHVVADADTETEQQEPAAS